MFDIDSFVLTVRFAAGQVLVFDIENFMSTVRFAAGQVLVFDIENFMSTVRFSAGQEGGSEPAQENGEVQNLDCKHAHGHRQGQGRNQHHSSHSPLSSYLFFFY